jgi:hypothetical protein
MGISELHASHIKKVRVGFIISGENLDHQKVTNALGLKPDLCANRGDTKIIGKAVSVHSEGFWRIDTQGKVNSKDINDHLNFLLSILLPHKDIILEMAQNGETFFDVLWKSTYLYAGTGPLIDRECLSGIGQLNAGMGFDIYQVDDDKPSETK